MTQEEKEEKAKEVLMKFFTRMAKDKKITIDEAINLEIKRVKDAHRDIQKYLTRDFPQYNSHEKAKKRGCFHCDTDMSTEKHEDSDYPPRLGQFEVRCPHCNMLNFYDVEEANSG